MGTQKLSQEGTKIAQFQFPGQCTGILGKRTDLVGDSDGVKTRNTLKIKENENVSCTYKYCKNNPLMRGNVTVHATIGWYNMSEQMKWGRIGFCRDRKDGGARK